MEGSFGGAEQADKVRHGVEMEAKARDHRAAWEAAIEEKKRLARMRPEESSFRKAIIARRTEKFEGLRVRPLPQLLLFIHCVYIRLGASVSQGHHRLL